MDPNLNNRISLLELVLKYIRISLDIKTGFTMAMERGAFSGFADVAVNPAKMTADEIRFIARLVPPFVIENVRISEETESVVPSAEIFLETLLKSEIDEGPVQRHLLQLLAEGQQLSRQQLIDLAKDLDSSVFRQIILLLDGDENHQNIYDLYMVALAQVLRRVPEIADEFRNLFAMRKEQNKLVFLAAPTLLISAPTDDALEDDESEPHKPITQSQQKVPSMSDQNEVADAISRLQDTFSTGLASMSSSGSRSFDTTLNELQYNTLSIPALGSEAALAMGEAKLADKIFKNLSQAVKAEPGVETTVYTFHPKHVRSLDYGGNSARGGAAIIAQEVETIRPAFLDRMRRLEPEECTCDDSLVDELINEAEEVLISIANEVSADTGPFTAKVVTLVNRLADTVVETMVSYGIRLEAWDRNLRVSEATVELFNLSIDRTRRDFAPAAVNSPKLQVGILAEDSNDEAVKSLIYMIDRLIQLFVDPDGPQMGAAFSRLLNRLDAIPPSVSDVRNALRRAGVSLVDQKASFVRGGKRTVYELDRLLSWIDEDIGKWHTDLSDGHATRRELRWMHQSLRDMLDGLSGFEAEKGAASPYAAATPKNDYAAARRQIRELMGLLDCASVDAVDLAQMTR